MNYIQPGNDANHLFPVEKYKRPQMARFLHWKCIQFVEGVHKVRVIFKFPGLS